MKCARCKKELQGEIWAVGALYCSTACAIEAEGQEALDDHGEQIPTSYAQSDVVTKFYGDLKGVASAPVSIEGLASLDRYARQLRVYSQLGALDVHDQGKLYGILLALACIYNASVGELMQKYDADNEAKMKSVSTKSEEPVDGQAALMEVVKRLKAQVNVVPSLYSSAMLNGIYIAMSKLLGISIEEVWRRCD